MICKDTRLEVESYQYVLSVFFFTACLCLKVLIICTSSFFCNKFKLSMPNLSESKQNCCLDLFGVTRVIGYRIKIIKVFLGCRKKKLIGRNAQLCIPIVIKTYSFCSDMGSTFFWVSLPCSICAKNQSFKYNFWGQNGG